MIEVEQRGLLTEVEYNELRAKLQEKAKFLGDDNKYVEYWIYSDKLLKLIKNTSKKNYVLSLKLNSIGNSTAYEEYEIKLSEEDFPKLEKIISNIAKPDQIIKGNQKKKKIPLQWRYFYLLLVVQNLPFGFNYRSSPK